MLGDLVYYLSQYQFKIRYASGKDNVEADSLSRNPVLECFENDDEILKVVNLITMDELLNDQRFNQNVIRSTKSVICKNNVCFKNIRKRQRLIVSEELVLWLIKKCHEFYGHIGRHHLAQKLLPFYYFKNMLSVIDQFCKQCEICIKNKTRRCRKQGLLSQLGPATRPFEILSIDTIGGFSGNRSPKKYLHLLVHHFSRKAFISTTKKQTTKQFIDLIDSVTRNETVEIILADQYSALNSKELKQYLESRNVQPVFTSVDNAASNGLNERLNQTLVNRIRCKISEHPKKAWSGIAEECVKEYNATTHSVTKFAPDYLMDGTRSDIVPEELVEERDLAKDRAEALLNSLEYFGRNKKRIDKHRTICSIKEGDYVYVENGSKLNRGKLDKVSIGPYRVLRKVSESMFEVDCGKKKREGNVFHCGKLIPVCENSNDA